jgi:hypothetical protein
MSEKYLRGITVDWEMKALLVAVHYALTKFLSKIINEYYLFIICRSFFVIGHLLFVWSFILVNSRIVKDITRSTDEKVKAKNLTQTIFRNLCIRAIIIAFIHFKTNLLPLLLISVYMGFFTLIENVDYYYMFYAMIPRLFELFF